MNSKKIMRQCFIVGISLFSVLASLSAKAYELSPLDLEAIQKYKSELRTDPSLMNENFLRTLPGFDYLIHKAFDGKFEIYTDNKGHYIAYAEPKTLKIVNGSPDDFEEFAKAFLTFQIDGHSQGLCKTRSEAIEFYSQLKEQYPVLKKIKGIPAFVDKIEEYPSWLEPTHLMMGSVFQIFRSLLTTEVSNYYTYFWSPDGMRFYQLTAQAYREKTEIVTDHKDLKLEKKGSIYIYIEDPITERTIGFTRVMPDIESQIFQKARFYPLTPKFHVGGVYEVRMTDPTVPTHYLIYGTDRYQPFNLGYNSGTTVHFFYGPKGVLREQSSTKTWCGCPDAGFQLTDGNWLTLEHHEKINAVWCGNTIQKFKNNNPGCEEELLDRTIRKNPKMEEVLKQQFVEKSSEWNNRFFNWYRESHPQSEKISEASEFQEIKLTPPQGTTSSEYSLMKLKVAGMEQLHQNIHFETPEILFGRF